MDEVTQTYFVNQVENAGNHLKTIPADANYKALPAERQENIERLIDELDDAWKSIKRLRTKKPETTNKKKTPKKGKKKS